MDKNTTKNRNTSLDVIKGIAAIFVVFIHVQFAGVAGEYIAKIGSFAVPLFFMVSGYFSHQASKEKLLRSVKNTVILIIVAYAINILRIFVLPKQVQRAYGRVNRLLNRIGLLK